MHTFEFIKLETDLTVVKLLTQIVTRSEMDAGNMMTNAGSFNGNNHMAGGMQMQGNNLMEGNLSTPNISAMNVGQMSANTYLASPASTVSSIDLSYAKFEQLRNSDFF